MGGSAVSGIATVEPACEPTGISLVESTYEPAGAFSFVAGLHAQMGLLPSVFGEPLEPALLHNLGLCYRLETARAITGGQSTTELSGIEAQKNFLGFSLDW